MIVRAEQMKVLELHAQRQFSADMAVYVRTLAPKLCAVAGDIAVLAMVERGIKRAGSYGFKRRGPIQFYLGMMCTLGSSFDSDCQFPWAAEVLKDRTIRNELIRADRLYERLRMYLDKVMGPGNEYAIAALGRLIDFFEEDPAGERILRGRVLRAAAWIYPEKLAFLGDNILAAMTSQAERQAGQFGLPEPRGAVLLAGMHLALGAGACSDPLYPWIAGTLEDPSIVDGSVREMSLRRKLRAYAQHMMQDPREA